MWFGDTLTDHMDSTPNMSHIYEFFELWNIMIQEIVNSMHKCPSTRDMKNGWVKKMTSMFNIFLWQNHNV